MSNNKTNSDIYFGDHTKVICPNNEQEQFWQGDFGNDYTVRNINFVENNYQMFRKVFSFAEGNELALNINSIIEFGAGSGQNIQALQKIFPDAAYYAIEINKSACDKMKGQKICVINGSMFDYFFDFSIDGKVRADLVLSKGLLIHIYPDDIEKAFDVLYNSSNKYILLCEYYSSERQEILYRGEHDKLWKFDFIKPMLDRSCKILDYGFVSKYDKYFEDDLTWFLFEK